MTAPNGPMLFNSSTGSDTAASGLGPASALSGVFASTTSASAVVTGITTTGVTAGDMLWVQSSSGRQFGVIASVDSGTQVTCDDVFANSESSRTWAIGGKRATLDSVDSRRVFDDLHGGWVIKSETSQTVSSPIAMTGFGDPDNLAVIDLGGNTVTYTSSSSFPLTLETNCLLKNGTFTKTTGSPSGIRVRSAANWGLGVCENIAMNGFSIGFYVDSYRTGHFHKCSASGGGFGFYAYVSVLTCAECVATNNTSAGFYCNNHSLKISDCISSFNSVGFQNTSAARSDIIVNSIAHGNTSHGIDTPSAIERCSGNILVSNGGYGINTSASVFKDVNRNAFYNNTSGEVTSRSFDLGYDITLTADPFVDAANLDFNLNSAAGGGATLRATNYTIVGVSPPTPTAGTQYYPFRQWVEDEFGGGGATHYDPFTNPRF